MNIIIAGTIGGVRLASLDLLDLVWQASWVVQLVILLLVAASVLSWAAIFFKWREIAGAEQDSEAFLDVYHEGSLDACYEAARELDRSPLAAIFVAVYSELRRMAKYAGRAPEDRLEEPQLHTLSKQIAWVGSQEGHRLESRLSFLATVGSASPFVGLFGTVIGIINAFTDIGIAGSASLAVVAPGIAEALIATAIGLFAAIPATIFYNVFVSRLRELHAEIDLFGDELRGDLARLAGPQAGSAPARAAEA
jgi:biopolymer transport protein TolQ